MGQARGFPVDATSRADAQGDEDRWRYAKRPHIENIRLIADEQRSLDPYTITTEKTWGLAEGHGTL